jgi:hypothetical protein
MRTVHSDPSDMLASVHHRGSGVVLQVKAGLFQLAFIGTPHAWGAVHQAAAAAATNAAAAALLPRRVSLNKYRINEA